MKLLIISNMAHYHKDGQIVGWGPAVEEINYLATIFDEIRHIACLHSRPAPPTALAYNSNKIRPILVPPSGGERLSDKLNILRLTPLYISKILRELPEVDAVHVRGPNNMSLLAVFLLALVSHPTMRWVKYGGNWKPAAREPRSFRFQRWCLLKGYHRGIVTVNGQWPNQPKHVVAFINPCITEREINLACDLVSQKTLSTPLYLLYVGALNDSKGAGRILKICNCLKEKGLSFNMDIVGDGPQNAMYQEMADLQDIQELVSFHGWMPHSALSQFYKKSHFVLLPSSQEGWPKVLSEAMAYGVVPIASDVGSIRQNLEMAGCGKALPALDIEAYVNGILGYIQQPDRWKQESLSGYRYAFRFTYENYLSDVMDLFCSTWGIALNSNTIL